MSIPRNVSALRYFSLAGVLCSMYLSLAVAGVFLKNKNDTDYINFYWDSTYPQILLKQLHTLKHNWIQGHDFVNGTVYNLRKPLIYKSAKSGSSFLSLRDSYLKTKHDNKLYEFFKSSVLPMQHLENNLRNIGSKSYAIE